MGDRKGKIMLTGSLVALITPMKTDGSIDYQTLGNLIEWHIEEKTDALVIAGTTGESATLSFQEHIEIIQFSVKKSAKRLPIIAGVGANNTKEAILLSQHAQEAGADYGLSVAPYYNRPSQEGLYQHFKTISEETALPLILYNVPKRTGSDISNDTLIRLAQLPGIVGYKDATGNLARALELFSKIGDNFLFYSGDDPTSMAYLLSGGHGVISVCANITPHLFANFCHAAIDKDFAYTKKLNDQLLGLYPYLFYEPSPSVIKWLLYKMNRILFDTLRLPIMPLSKECQAVVEKALASYQLF